VPVRLIGPLFLGIVGATAAEATQAVGALLLLGLLAAPAAAAVRLTDRPWLALAASVGFAVSSVWIGLGAAYGLPRVPPSFAILAAATILYAASATWRARDSGRRSPTYG
jgi:zinc/manganese transport system permease protein